MICQMIDLNMSPTITLTGWNSICIIIVLTNMRKLHGKLFRHMTWQCVISYQVFINDEHWHSGSGKYPKVVSVVSSVRCRAGW